MFQLSNMDEIIKTNKKTLRKNPLLNQIHKLFKLMPPIFRRTLVVLLFVIVTKICIVYRTYYPKDGRSLICSFGEGRLGNQLSAFATLYAFSQSYGNDEFYDYSDISNPKYFYGHALNIGDYPNQIKAFHKYLHPLRRILTFKPRFRESADLKLRSAKAAKEIDLKRKIETFIGVHIRRTDYLNHLKNTYLVEPVKLDYFYRAMDFYQAKLKNSAIFIVVSDDLNWAKEYLPRTDVVFAGNTKIAAKDVKHPYSYSDDVGEDMALLAACNHTIMSFGTFGLWGGLLAGGQVVLPKEIMNVKEGLELENAGLLGNNSGWFLL